MNNTKKFLQGFTLIELLVVVAIIGLLSSVVLSSLNTARAKARDAQAKAVFHSLQQALILYYDKYGRYPNETPVMTNMWVDNFNSMAGQLVTEKFLAQVPVPPANHAYNYYNYGGAIGGLLVTTLEAFPAQTAAYAGTCRPFSTGNWCDTTISSTYYCICNPY
ncbi:MAG: prepilin-type N-terminal cleavage/methylation domain-containing protein [Minisyncoccia bacterium]